MIVITASVFRASYDVLDSNGPTDTLSLIRECGESLLDDDDATDKLTVKIAGCKKV